MSEPASPAKYSVDQLVWFKGSNYIHMVREATHAGKRGWLYHVASISDHGRQTGSSCWHEEDILTARASNDKLQLIGKRAVLKAIYDRDAIQLASLQRRIDALSLAISCLDKPDA